MASPDPFKSRAPLPAGRAPVLHEHPPMTVDVAFVHGLASGMTARGLDLTPVLVAAGIAPALLAREHARVTLAQYAALQRAMIDHLDDEMVGLLQRPSRRGCFMLQARAAIAAPTLGQAIRHVAHTAQLIYDDFSPLPVRDGDLAGLALQFHAGASAANPFVHEVLLRCYWRLFAWLVGGQLPALRFDFAFDRPTYAEGYARIFPAPWRFQAERSAMWFDASRLKLPVCRDEASMRAFMAQAPSNVIIPTRDTGIGGRVRVHLQQTQPAWPDLEHTARALNLSASTLQRQLAIEGTSFQTLKDHLRRDIAIFRLTTSTVALATLAGELGFADSFTFQRAFKGWTGCPPGAYRRSMK
jgi:AraC-like DNA-binding protein